jgi:hypothetical protein
MRKKITLGIVAVSLLAVLAGCDLYTGISLTWDITYVQYLGNGVTRVGYTVRNVGRYDLKGVNLEIGVDVNHNQTYSATGWTSSFNLSQGQSITTSLDVVTLVDPTTGWATVLSVDMDNP